MPDDWCDNPRRVLGPSNSASPSAYAATIKRDVPLGLKFRSRRFVDKPSALFGHIQHGFVDGIVFLLSFVELCFFSRDSKPVTP
jgi:hypothetical protein